MLKLFFVVGEEGVEPSTPVNKVPKTLKRFNQSEVLVL